MLAKITLIAAITVLPLLFIAPKSSFIKKLGIPILIVAILAHIGVHFLDPNPLNLKFLSLFKSLGILAAISLVFTYIRSNKIVQIALYIALLVGVKYFYLDTPVPPDMKIAGLDDEFELLVQLKEGKSILGLDEHVKKYDLKVERAFYPSDETKTDLDDYFVVGIPDPNENKLQEIIRAISSDEDAEWVEHNEEITLAPLTEVEIQKSGIPSIELNDPLIKEQWGLTKTDVGAYYDWLRNSNITAKKKTRIAILDTGVDSNHEDLKDNYSSFQRKYDNDPKGHGTLCAGVAAAVSNNKIGIASLVPSNEFVEVSSIKVLNNYGMGTQQKIIKGIIEAADKKADIISMSLGGPSSDSKQKAYNSAVDYANQSGAIVIVAAGNSNRNAKGFSPANAKGVIAVSALDENMNRASFSNTVEDLEMAVAAPGVNIHSTYPGNKYGSYSGTSFAAPYVSGLVAVMKSIQPDLDTRQAFDILNDSGITVGAGNLTGNIISPKNALDRLVSEMNQ